MGSRCRRLGWRLTILYAICRAIERGIERGVLKGTGAVP